VDKEASKSLVYHLDMVEKTTYDIRYLVNFLKSASETKRIESERRLVSEMESMMAKQAVAAEKAELESKERHKAATKIAGAFRSKRSRKLIKSRRDQVNVQNEIAKAEQATLAAIKIQSRFRVYSVRNFLESELGIVFKVNRKKKKKRLTTPDNFVEKKRHKDRKAVIQSRVDRDVHQRRLNSRNNLVFSLCRAYCNTCQVRLLVIISCFICNDVIDGLDVGTKHRTLAFIASRN
jgi:hypothetical protein